MGLWLCGGDGVHKTHPFRDAASEEETALTGNDGLGENDLAKNM